MNIVVNKVSPLLVKCFKNGLFKNFIATIDGDVNKGFAYGDTEEDAKQNLLKELENQ